MVIEMLQNLHFRESSGEVSNIENETKGTKTTQQERQPKQPHQYDSYAFQKGGKKHMKILIGLRIGLGV